MHLPSSSFKQPCVVMWLPDKDEWCASFIQSGRDPIRVERCVFHEGCCVVRCCKFDSKSLRSNQWGVAPPCQVTCWCPLSATSPLFTSSTSSPICLLNLCSHLVLVDTVSFKKWIVLLNEYSGFKKKWIFVLNEYSGFLKNEYLFWMNILDFYKMNNLLNKYFGFSLPASKIVVDKCLKIIWNHSGIINGT